MIDNTHIYLSCKGASFDRPCEKFTGWNKSILILNENV